MYILIFIVLFMIFLYYNTYCKCIDRFNIGVVTPSRVATLEMDNYKLRTAFRFAETFLKNVKYDINYNYETSLNSITFNLADKDKNILGVSKNHIKIPIFNSISYIPYKINGEIINIYFYILYWNKDLHPSDKWVHVKNTQMDDIQSLVDGGFIDSHTSLLNKIKLKDLEDHANPERLSLLHDRWDLMDDLITDIVTNLDSQDLHEILQELYEGEEIDKDESDLIRWIVETQQSSSIDINEGTLVSGAGFNSAVYPKDLMIKDFETLFYIPKQELYNGYGSDQLYGPPRRHQRMWPPDMTRMVREKLKARNINFSDFTFIKKNLSIRIDKGDVSKKWAGNDAVVHLKGDKYLIEMKEDILVVDFDEVIEKQIELHEIYNPEYEKIINCLLPDYLCEQHKCNWVAESNRCLTDSYCNNDSDCTDTEVCEFFDGKCQYIN